MSCVDTKIFRTNNDLRYLYTTDAMFGAENDDSYQESVFHCGVLKEIHALRFLFFFFFFVTIFLLIVWFLWYVGWFVYPGCNF